MWVRKIISVVATAAGGLVMGAAGVGPKDAASNLSAWADWLGLSDLGHWLAQYHVWVIAGAAATVGFSLAVFLLSFLPVRAKEATRNRAELFLDRPALEARYGARPLDNVATAHCVWLVGTKSFRINEELHKVSCLLLPNPNSASLKDFQKNLPGTVNLFNEIHRVTLDAQDKGIAVKWYPELTGQSWWIGDRDTQGAFVHIECLMPFSQTNRRPSFRVYRSQDEDFYKRYCEIFDKMFYREDSVTPVIDESWRTK
jgi:hypothetical protein